MPKVKFVQIAVDDGRLFCLNKKGEVWVNWATDMENPSWYKIPSPNEE